MLDPITLLVILMLMKRRGRGDRDLDEMLPLILSLTAGQNPFTGATPGTPTTVPAPVTQPPTPPVGLQQNPLLLLLLIVLLGGEGGFGELFGRRREGDAEVPDTH